jgi:hypothetical protein
MDSQKSISQGSQGLYVQSSCIVFSISKRVFINPQVCYHPSLEHHICYNPHDHVALPFISDQFP